MDSVLLSPIRIDELEGIIQKSLKKVLGESGSADTGSNDEVLNVHEAAKLIKLKVPTIYGLVAEGKIPYSKPGKNLIFFKSELIRWIRSGKGKTMVAVQNPIFITNSQGGRA